MMSLGIINSNWWAMVGPSGFEDSPRLFAGYVWLKGTFRGPVIYQGATAREISPAMGRFVHQKPKTSVAGSRS